MTWQSPGDGQDGPQEPSPWVQPPADQPPAQPYGQPAPPQFGQPYVQQYPAFGPGLPAGVQYASWARRVGAALLDGLVVLLPWIPFGIVIAVLSAGSTGTSADGTADLPAAATAVFGLGYLTTIGVQIWNSWRAGSRGQSLGKQWVGIHLVNETSLRPPGGWTAIGKALLRGVLGAFSCGLYTLVTLLWPLWDQRRQTLDDKVVKTVEVCFPGNTLP